MARVLFLSLGALALSTTLATLCTQAALSSNFHYKSPGRSASIVSAVLESLLLISMSWLYATLFFPTISGQAKRHNAITFGLGLVTCLLSVVTAIVGLAYSAKVNPKMPSGIVAAASATLVLSLPCQVGFLIVTLLWSRTDTISATWSFQKDEESSRSRKIGLKAIRYSSTFPIIGQTPTISQAEFPEGLSSNGGGKSTVTAIRTSLTSMTQVIRPTASLTKLISRETDRSASIDSTANRSSGGDTFDSWDTSTVDLHNRQAVLEISSPTLSKNRPLETIPASPTASRSPSPDSFVELEPPPARIRHRSRSYSPVSIQRELLPPSTPGANSESHIHPLFRSDSPDPPPLATPGTRVVAAPDAGKVIVHRASNRSLNRMRSGSLPMSPSPLSKQNSLEGSKSPKAQREELRIALGPAAQEGESETEAGRRMTPPLPEWLLSGRAGTR